MKCPICNVNSNILYANMFDDRYGYPQKFNLHQCVNCHHKFLEHDFSASDLADLYTNYYPRSKFTIDDYQPLTPNNIFSRWFNDDSRAYTYVPENVTIWDIGCGFGGSISYHQNRGCAAYGVEADSSIQKIKDKFGFKIKVDLFDANDYTLDFFDYVGLSFGAYERLD